MIGRNGRESEEFRFEVVIRQQFIDTPEAEFAQRRREQMSVDINKAGCAENFFDDGVDAIDRQ